MKIRSKVSIGLLSSAMCVAAFAHAAGKYSKAGGPSAVLFQAKGPGGLTIDGKVPDVAIAHEEGADLVFKVDLNKLTTGIGLRDDHTKAMLRTKDPKFAMAELRVPKGSVGLDKHDGKGKFTLNGKTNDLAFKYKATEEKGNYNLEAKFQFNITDYGVKEEQLCRFEVCAKPLVQVIARVAVVPPAG